MPRNSKAAILLALVCWSTACLAVPRYAIFPFDLAAALKAAEAAKLAAAARSEAILKVPIWQHSLKCLAFVGAAVWGAAFLSGLLHREADRVEAGEVIGILIYKSATV